MTYDVCELRCPFSIVYALLRALQRCERMQDVCLALVRIMFLSCGMLYVIDRLL